MRCSLPTNGYRCSNFWIVDTNERLEAIAEALSIPTAQHHIFLCADQTTPKCASRRRDQRTLGHLKNRLKAAGLTSAPPSWSRQARKRRPTPAEPGEGRCSQKQGGLPPDL